MISLQKISKRFGDKVLYDDCTLTLQPVSRTALIGPNGAGKSMLFKLILGLAEPDSGSVVLPSDLTVSHLPQEMDFDEEETPLSLALKPFKQLFEREKEVFDIDTQAKSFDSQMKEMDHFLNKTQHLDLHALPSKAQRYLSGLGIPQEKLDRPLDSLSGGYRMRAVLAGLLLQEPDLLLLDEPTNHLDYDSLIWLERFFNRFAGGLLIISHDRDFIQRTTNQTVELKNASITSFNGPFNKYVQWREQQEESNQRRAKNLEEKINQTETFINRFKAKATKATQAQSRVKQLEKLQAEYAQIGAEHATRHESVMHLQFASASRSGAVPILLDRVSAGYQTTPVLENIDFELRRGDKTAIIGPNGAGKSTLLKVCAGLLPPTCGTRTIGHNTVLNYFSQHRLDQLDPGKNLFDSVALHAPSLTPQQVRSILGAFLFPGSDIEKKVAILSGGEKSRLSLAMLLANPGNVLLLDEPTNHLDMQSVEMLASALQRFDGTLMIVSHDEYFLSICTNRIIEIRPGQFRDYPGGLSDYRSSIEAGLIDSLEKTDEADQAPAQQAVSKEQRIKNRDLRKKLTREIEKIEKSVAELENKIASVQQQLDDPANGTNVEILSSCQQELQQLETQLEDLMYLWQGKNEQLEQLER